LATPTAAIEAFHREVDAAVRPLESEHGPRLRCQRGCSSCCVDDIRVFEIEAELIRWHHAELLAGGAPRAEGACAFLDADGACRIYEHRPYVCRTQGLPLRWVDEEAAVESRDICALNEPGGPDLVQLPAASCWTLGPHEARLATLEAERSGRWPRPSDRVALRDLFRASSCGR
jgi:Fe-S-cluster containining protein